MNAALVPATVLFFILNQHAGPELSKHPVFPTSWVMFCKCCCVPVEQSTPLKTKGLRALF